MALNIKELVKRAKEYVELEAQTTVTSVCLDEKTSCCLSALLTKRSLDGGS